MPLALNPRYSFPEFVVGRSNEAAYVAASAAAVSPGELYNPVLITGSTGLGKTHLAHAVTAESAMRAEGRAVLLTADEMLRELAVAVAAGERARVLASLSGARMIVLDDVHVLDRHAAAQEVLAELATQCVTERCQLLLTSDDAAGAGVLASRLVSRFRRAHIAPLGAPDWEHRVAILQAKCVALGKELPPSVLNHLASQSAPSVRALEGSLTRLLAYAALEGGAVTLELARRALPSRREPAGDHDFGARAVQEAVAAEWGVAPEALVGDGRARTVTQARRIGMLLCRDHLSLSLREIGTAFGDRDNSTVLSALARAKRDLESDARAAERVERLRSLLPA